MPGPEVPGPEVPGPETEEVPGPEVPGPEVPGPEVTVEGRQSTMPAMMLSPGREHGGQVELEPERIGRRHRRDDHLEPLERQRPGGQRRLRGPPRGQRRGPGLPRLPRGPELAGPEQFGDLLEGAADREAAGVQAAETEAVAGDLGDSRLDCDVRDPGGPPWPPPPGQPLDLVGVEQAAPAVRSLAPAEHAAADVRIQRRGLDAEPTGGLGGGQEIGHALPPAFVRDIEFNQY